MKPADKGWFFSCGMTATGNKSYVSCNVSDPELRLIKTLLAVRRRRLLVAAAAVCGQRGCAGLRGGAQALAAASVPDRLPPPHRACALPTCIPPAPPQFLMPRLLGFDEHFAGAPMVVEGSGGGGAAAAEAAAGAPF